jgi:hypothetical protein
MEEDTGSHHTFNSSVGEGKPKKIPFPRAELDLPVLNGM